MRGLVAVPAPPQANRTEAPVAQAAPAEPQVAPRAPETANRDRSTAGAIPDGAEGASAGRPRPVRAGAARKDRPADGTARGNGVATGRKCGRPQRRWASVRLVDTACGEWRCDAVGTPSILTRSTTTRACGLPATRSCVTWSYQGQVVRTVNLEVRANPEVGFRTFSRQTVSGRGSGPWEVALIAPDGAVIDTQRFAVTER